MKINGNCKLPTKSIKNLKGGECFIYKETFLIKIINYSFKPDKIFAADLSSENIFEFDLDKEVIPIQTEVNWSYGVN